MMQKLLEWAKANWQTVAAAILMAFCAYGQARGWLSAETVGLLWLVAGGYGVHALRSGNGVADNAERLAAAAHDRIDMANGLLPGESDVIRYDRPTDPKGT